MVAKIVNFLEHFCSHASGAVKLITDFFIDYKHKFVVGCNHTHREKTAQINSSEKCQEQ